MATTSNDTRFENFSRVAEGAYAIVYKAWDTTEGTWVALKQFKDKLSSEIGMPATVIRELSILKFLRTHDNICTLYGLYTRKERMYVIYKLYDTDLRKYLVRYRKRLSRMHKVQAVSILRQVLAGLQHCHSHGVFHRDLKPANIFLNYDGSVVIGDFGLARMGLTDGDFTVYTVTRWYRAPEVILEQPYSFLVDVWSAGVIFSEMARLRVLFPGQSQVDQLAKILNLLGTSGKDLPIEFPGAPESEGDMEAIVPNMGDEGVDLIRRMLSFDPEERITAQAALSHPFFV